MPVLTYAESFGTFPKIPISISYEQRRSGDYMEYKIKIIIGVLPSPDAYFPYSIRSTISLDGTVRDTKLIKDGQPIHWDTSYVYESPWLRTAEKKISSLQTTSLQVRLSTDNPLIYNVYPSAQSSYSLSVIQTLVTTEIPDVIYIDSNLHFVFRYPGLNTKCTLKYRRIGMPWNDMGTSTPSRYDSLNWMPIYSEAFKNVSPEKNDVPVIFRLTTYDENNTEIDYIDYPSTIAIPDYSPIIESFVTELVNSNPTISEWGVAVSGFTQLSLSIQARTKYGATIQPNGYELINVTGKNETIHPNSSSYISPPLPRSDREKTYRVQAIVTDSRNRTSPTMRSQIITVYDYSEPKITGCNVFRCIPDGSISPNGDYINVSLSGDCSSIGGRNNISKYIKIQDLTDGSYREDIPLNYETNNILPNLDTSKSYRIYFVVTDTLGTNSSERYIDIPVGSPTVGLPVGGNGIGFGKFPEKDGIVDSKWPINAPYMELDGHETRSNIAYEAECQLGKAVSSGKHDTLCSVTIDQPGSYICIGAVEGDATNSIQYSASIQCNMFPPTIGGRSYGIDCCSTFNGKGGVSTFKWLHILPGGSTVVDLRTFNYSTGLATFRGHLVCFRVDAVQTT